MRKSKDYYWGFVFILIGTTILLNMGGYLTQFSPFKLGISIIFLSLALKGLFKREFTSAGLYTAILLHINAESLGLKGSTFAIYAASLLIGFGLSKLFRKKSKFGPKIYVNGEERNIQDFKKTSTEEHDGDVLNLENNLGSSVRYIKSQNLKSVLIENNLGSSTIYFDKAIFVDGAVIRVENNLGNTKLYFPGNINLQNTLSASLGSIQGSGSFHNSSDYPTVFLQGEAALGSIEVYIM